MEKSAWELLISVPVAVLGSINADGTPHLVPFTFAPLGQDRLVTAVDAKPKSTRRLRRLDNLRRDPRVTVLAHHYEPDWRGLWWVRADGSASVSETGATAARQALTKRYPQYDSQTLGPWVTITVESLSSWMATPG